MDFFRIIFHFEINDQCFGRADLNFAKFYYFFQDFDFNLWIALIEYQLIEAFEINH
jgi:hypothetical protein